jgi:hypothetical protein
MLLLLLVVAVLVGVKATERAGEHTFVVLFN